MKWTRRLRDLPGVVLRDLPRYLKALSPRHAGVDGAGWTALCNRNEVLLQQVGRRGFQCDWQWGSELHAPLVLPSLGRRLMQVALQEWPIRFAEQPILAGEHPKVSFVIAHAGEERLPQLLQVLKSLFGQQDVGCECIVVDQSPMPLRERLPAEVRYHYLDKSGLPPGWRKSWAFNVGAKMARADILVFQDGDICVPASYARELVTALGDDGYGAASLQRVLFYLAQGDTARVLQQPNLPDDCVPTSVFQNWKGGTIAIRKDAFKAMGGFDEGFVDWGGEDDEFYDRCAEVGHIRTGYLPFVHLWHAPQAKRKAADNLNTIRVLPARLAIPRQQRMAELNTRAWGDAARPDPVQRYA